MLRIEHLTKKYGETKAVDDLSLQIGKVYLIRICDADSAYARCSEIHRCRRTESARTYDEHLGIEQLLLSLCAYLLEDDMTRIALYLFVGKCHY